MRTGLGGWLDDRFGGAAKPAELLVRVGPAPV
jgi:hypothetical protein